MQSFSKLVVESVAPLPKRDFLFCFLRTFSSASVLNVDGRFLLICSYLSTFHHHSYQKILSLRKAYVSNTVCIPC